MTRFAHVSLVALALVFASACGSSEAPATVGAEAEMAANGELGAEALVEQHDDGSVAWRIDPDGQVKAAVSTSAGARVTQDIGGTLVFKVEGGEPRTVPLVLDAKTGLLVAAGPKLEAELTEISYTVTVSGKPWSGVMHVSAGGTAALVAGAKLTAEAKLSDEAVGPHGGTIQVVGNDRLEMVADADTGETRVYVLDVDLRPVKVEARTLRMGFIADKTMLINFAPEPAGFYFTANLGAAVKINPLRVTASLGIGGVTHAAIWGYRPGVRIYAPSATVKIATAPRIRFVLKGGFDSDVDVYGRAHTKVVVQADDDDRKNGDNGRHVGQDGTWARDSGGFKSDDGRDDPHGGKARGGDPGGDPKGGGSSKSSSNGSKGGGDSKGGGSSKGGGGKGGKK
jgi:uncharacterized membrane protein YgcG